MTATPSVRHDAPGHRSNCGSYEERAANGTLLDRGECQTTGQVGHVHVRERSGNDTRVVAEEQRAQGRHGSERTDSSMLARWRGFLNHLTDVFFDV